MSYVMVNAIGGLPGDVIRVLASTDEGASARGDIFDRRLKDRARREGHPFSIRRGSCDRLSEHRIPGISPTATANATPKRDVERAPVCRSMISLPITYFIRRSRDRASSSSSCPVCCSSNHAHS